MRQILFYTLIPAALSACAGNDVIVQRQTSMEGRLEQVMQTQIGGKEEIAGIGLQLKELKDQLAKRTAADEDVRNQLEDLQNRVKMLSLRLEQVETPAKQSTLIELVNRDETGSTQEATVQAEYMKAFGLFSANNYAAAADAFKAFIAHHPESEYAANARYWLAECSFSTERYQEAIATFTTVLDAKPSNNRAAEALLKIGLSWGHLGERDKAATALRAVVDNYPESEAAVKARQQLGTK